MDIKTELDNFLGEKRALVEAIVRESRRGVSAMEISRHVAPAFGRDVVKEFLASVDRHDRARVALRQAGLDGPVAVRMPSIDKPRAAALSLDMDPLEIPDLASVPARVREALRDIHIALCLPPRDERELTPTLTDELLLDGEEFHLAALKPAG
ncbi:hypothetical protein [Kitasatospora sp. NPDC098663]|uniref:hypothetical protein n=1 Tax=Kitasatospora sp. NPDC098663 TaxID=3364096 RepID=UPI0037FE6B7A